VPSVSIYAAVGFAEQAFRLDAYDIHNHLLDSSAVLAQGYEKLSVSGTGITRAVLSREVGSGKVRVMVPDVSGAPGDAVTITVDASDDSRNVAGIAATLTYDTSLTLTDASQVAVGALLEGGLREVNTGAPNTLTITAAGPEGHNGPGPLLVIPMTIAADAEPGRHPLALSNVTLYDPQGNALLTETLDGTLTVNDSTPPPPDLCGDFNADGKLNIQDATLALRMSVGIITPTDAQTTAACGNPINVAFTTRILRAVVGLAPPPTPNAIGGLP
jgi:hypothetical protein